MPSFNDLRIKETKVKPPIDLGASDVVTAPRPTLQQKYPYISDMLDRTEFPTRTPFSFLEQFPASARVTPQTPTMPAEDLRKAFTKTQKDIRIKNIHTEQGIPLAEFETLGDIDKKGLWQTGEFLETVSIEGERRIRAGGEPLSPLKRLDITGAEIATTPLFEVKGVPISASDITALGLIGFGAYQGVKILGQLFQKMPDKLLQASLNTGLDKWIAQRSRGVPPQKFKTAQDILYNMIAKNRTWLQERATENMLRRMQRGVNRTQAAQQVVKETIDDFENNLLPTLTVTNTAVPEQKMTLAEIITGLRSPALPSVQAVQGVEARLGQPAEIRKTLPTLAETNKLTSTQAQAKKIGLDVEAVQGISPKEYWVGISLPALTPKPEFTEWLATLPNESIDKVNKLLVGKFELRQGDKELGFGRKRFIPFKNIEDAQKFIATGDTSLISSRLDFKGQPMSAKSLAQARQGIQPDVERQERIAQQLPPVQGVKAELTPEVTPAEVPVGEAISDEFIADKIEAQRIEPLIAQAKESGFSVTSNIEELPPVKSGNIRLYHGTFGNNLDSIKQKGIIAQAEGTPVLATKNPQLVEVGSVFGNVQVVLDVPITPIIKTQAGNIVDLGNSVATENLVGVYIEKRPASSVLKAPFPSPEFDKLAEQIKQIRSQPTPAVPEAGVTPPEAVSEGVTPQVPPEAPTATTGAITPPARAIPPTVPEVRRAEIKELLATPANKLPTGVKKIELNQELKAINKQLVPVEKKLRQKIMATATVRSISPTQRQKIFKEIGGSRHLSEISLEKLNKILPAIQTARPVRIRGKSVITETTEKSIQSLKGTLISSGKFTQDAYQNTMKNLKLGADRFNSVDSFITETEGKSIIKSINQQAEVGLIEWDNKVATALADKPELAKGISDIKGRITTEAEVYEGGKPVGISPMWDMEVYTQKLQERTGDRIYDVYERAVNKHLEAEQKIKVMDEVLTKVTPLFKKIAKDPVALDRINRYIAAKNKLSGFESPKDITSDEILVAKQIEKDLLAYVPDIRFSRFYNAYHKYDGNVDLIKNDIPNAPIKAIKEASGIYESQGYEALYDYLLPKDWGVIKQGYEPHIAMNPKLQLNKIRSSVVGKGRLQTRHELDFTNQDKDILQRRKAYIRQMENLKLEPYFKEMDRIFRDIVPKLKQPQRVAESLNLAMDEMKGYVVEGTLARVAMRLAGWSFSTLSLSPHMFFRNLLQNPALHPDTGVFLNPSNRTLNEQEMKYIGTYVSQFQGVVKDYLLQEGMGNTPIERLLKKITYYGKSDEVNRIASFWASMNNAERAVIQYNKDGNIGKFMKSSGIEELYTTEQKHVLELLSQDTVSYGADGIMSVSGGEGAAREIARLITLGTHFRYRRFQRAPIEMGTSGRVVGSLMTFPRGVGQKLYRHYEKAKPGSKAPLHERTRALKSLIMAIIGTTMAGEVYKRATGKKYNSYNLLNILSYGPGGLAFGALEAIADIYGDISSIMLGDEFSRDELVKDIARGGDMFFPLYGQLLNVLETLTNQKFLDRKMLRKVREIIDPKYEVNEEYYKQDRTPIGMIQHAIFGGEPDVATPIDDASGDLEWDLLFNDYYNYQEDRYAYRKQNPETDVALFITNKVTTLQSAEAKQIVDKLVKEYKIDTTLIKGYEKYFGEEVTKPIEPSGFDKLRIK